MAEYIEREALVDVLAVSHAHHANNSREASLLDRDIRLIWEQPTADVVPVVHGRWVQVIYHVEFEDGFVDRLYECCSRCHEPNGRKATNYCPNCGANMTEADGNG